MKKFLLFFIMLCLWVGKAQAQFAGGNGTVGNPYLISTPQQLALLGTGNAIDLYFKLMNDIDMDGYLTTMSGWTPFTLYKRHLDGANFTIRNFYSNQDSDEVGLFSTIELGSVKNLRITIKAGEKVRGQKRVGAIAGYAHNGSYISNCYAEGNVEAGDDKVGGIVGEISNTTIEKCKTQTRVRNSGINLQGIGGIVGSAFNSCLISECVSDGVLFTNFTSYVGGIVGTCSFTQVQNSYFKGTHITPFGSPNSELYYFGGIAGSATNSVFLNCYASATIPPYPFQIAGGVLAHSTNISTCTFTGCFWDSTTTGVSTSLGGTPLTFAQTQTPSTFTNAGWDFATIWHAHPTYFDNRPFLRNECYELT